MKKQLVLGVVALGLLWATAAWAQSKPGAAGTFAQAATDKPEKSGGAKAAPEKVKAGKAKVKEDKQPEPPPPPSPPSENTFEACKDGADNDADGHVDCDDQDCEIYAMCVEVAAKEQGMLEPPVAQETGPVDCSDGVDNDRDEKIDCKDDSCLYEYWCRSTPMSWNAPTEQGAQCGDSLDNDADGLVDCDEPACATNPYCVPGPEEGLRCRDNKDNDANGLIDCEESSCQGSFYCRRRIYYTPVTPGRPMGWMVSVGVGLAMPNWTQPEAKGVVIDSGFKEKVPFNAKLGLALNLEVAYLPVPWFGMGVSGTVIGAWDSTREPFDSDYSLYKYDAAKLQGGIGGFVRLQVPVWDRFVPFVNLHAGYSYSKYYWVVYPSADDWEDIDEGNYSARATPEYGIGHASFMVEPGFDAFVRERSVAIGLRAQLPVATYKWRAHDTDSAALFLSVSYTPSWREKPVMRPEYANPTPRPVGEAPSASSHSESELAVPSAEAVAATRLPEVPQSADAPAVEPQMAKPEPSPAP